jgi:glycosyltransferase involved in cell wall biosynthesis
MRLAFVAPPNSIHTRRWVGWFARAGHAVSLVDPVGVEVRPGLPEGVPVLRPDGAATSPLSRRSAFRRVLLDLRPDVVHAHYLTRYAWAAAVAGIGPLVVSPWGSDLLQVRASRLRTRLWNGFALRRADLVTISSQGMRAAAIAAGARPDRIRLVHHGVDTSMFTPGSASEAFRARVGVSDAPVILSPRTVTRLYHHDVVLDAVAELGRRVSPAPAMVVSTAGADGQTLAGLRDRATAAGMADRLRILEGLTPHELPDLYRVGDVVVSVPETDSFAVTLLEAMACARPVVVTDVPAVGPVMSALDPVASSLIVPVGDVSATASAIERALSLGGAERDRLGQTMRRYVVEHAEYDTNMAAMEVIYRDLASGRR